MPNGFYGIPGLLVTSARREDVTRDEGLRRDTEAQEQTPRWESYGRGS